MPRVKEKAESEKPAVKKEKFIYAKGARKTAVAQARLFKGKGGFEVNGKKFNEYFPTELMQKTFLSPLEKTNHLKDLDISIHVHSGGIHAQADACRHAISRGLLLIDESLRPLLKAEGFLTRDPRVKERKKPGLRRARRAPQWSKR